MTIVELVLPDEVMLESGLKDEVTRGDGVVSIVLEGLNAVATVTTVAAVAAQLPALAGALRRWIVRRARPVRLRLKGRRTDLTIDLPPNVSEARISEVVRNLLEIERESDPDSQ